MAGYPLYRRLGGHQDRSRRVWKISLPPGYDPRTVQPVAYRYTDWAIPAHQFTWLDYYKYPSAKLIAQTENYLTQIQ